MIFTVLVTKFSCYPNRTTDQNVSAVNCTVLNSLDRIVLQDGKATCLDIFSSEEQTDLPLASMSAECDVVFLFFFFKVS